MRVILASLAALSLCCATGSNRCYTTGHGDKLTLPSGAVLEGSVQFRQYGTARDIIWGGGEADSDIAGVCGRLKRGTKDTGITEQGSETLLGLGQLGADAATGGATAVIRRATEDD